MFLKLIRKNVLKKYKNKLKLIKQKYENDIKKQKNEFISILNHDIKTPVLAQNHSLELLLNDKFGLLNNEQKEILKEIYNSNNFLLEVIMNALFLEKYENFKKEMKFEKIDILEQVMDCCELIKNQAMLKSQNIVIKTNRNKNIKLEADRKSIQRIILNILSSSISYGFENSKIEISVSENRNSISFCAKNKSIYMTKEKINSLFEDKKGLSDFNQLGMNLNLNIAQKLINAHNWDIIA